MKRKRFTEEQIAFALRQAEAGTAVAVIVRKLGVSEQTFYRWKKKYAGMGVAEVRRLKQLEEENRCDLHPRWSPDGRQVCIDSAHEGERQMYIVDVSELVDRT
jgi:putative transposase